MRYALLPFLTLILCLSAAHAQSISDDLPPAVVIGGEGAGALETAAPAKPTLETFTVSDVNADVTADTASHARDKALVQAERLAYVQLCGRLSAADNSADLDDDAIAGLVQSFEVQSERLSSVRYIGVFTIRFKPISTQKRIGTSVDLSISAPGGESAAPKGPVAHITVAIQTDSLADWAQIKRRLAAVTPVLDIATLDLARGLSHIDLAYSGTLDNLKSAVTAQGFVLRQNNVGVWQLNDGSMVPR